MSVVNGYDVKCDGCGEIATEKSHNGMSKPKLAGWIEGSTCTAEAGVFVNRFHACSVNCLEHYAVKRQCQEASA